MRNWPSSKTVDPAVLDILRRGFRLTILLDLPRGAALAVAVICLLKLVCLELKRDLVADFDFAAHLSLRESHRVCPPGLHKHVLAVNIDDLSLDGRPYLFRVSDAQQRLRWATMTLVALVTFV